MHGSNDSVVALVVFYGAVASDTASWRREKKKKKQVVHIKAANTDPTSFRAKRKLHTLSEKHTLTPPH